MRVLHLSATPLSGSPIRISQLLQKYSGFESRHICWNEKIGYRIYDTDVIGSRTPIEELEYLVYEWATHIHYHNRWRRQEIFGAMRKAPPDLPSVIQIHSPRESEDFREEAASGIPLAIIAQYHPRQWPEKSFIIPNVVDIYDPLYTPVSESSAARAALGMMTGLPIVSYAPSNTNARGWDDKSYSLVNPVLKRMRFAGEIFYDLIHKVPFSVVMPRKKLASIGVEEISSGSYHLSALEYLSVGIPCICRIDSSTEEVVKTLTGAEDLPFIDATKDSFERVVRGLINEGSYVEKGRASRLWMERHWSPRALAGHYTAMYEKL